MAAPSDSALMLDGPAGAIEAVLSAGDRPAVGVAVVCHPHPLHEGTMHNKVAYTLARTFANAGIPALRFNFRGVGASEGVHDNGDGETDDAVAMAATMRARHPGLPVWLAGFSFGAFVRTYPHLRGTITDLLIGDLFTDRVDAVWGPMESLYRPDKAPIPPWHAGTPGESVQERAPYLELPERPQR